MINEEVPVISPKKAQQLYYEILNYHETYRWTYPSFDISENIQNAINRFIRGLPFSPIDLLEGIKNFFKKLWNDVMKPLIDSILSYLKEVFSPILDVFGTLYEGIKGAVLEAGKMLIAGITTTINSIISFSEDIWSFVQTIPETITTFVSTIAETITTTIKSVGDTIWSNVSQMGEMLGSAFEYIRGQLQQFWNTVINHLTAIAEAFTNALTTVGNMIMSALQSLGQWITQGLKTIWNGITTSLIAVAKTFEDAWNNMVQSIMAWVDNILELSKVSFSPINYKQMYEKIHTLRSITVTGCLGGSLTVSLIDAVQILSNLHFKDTFMYILDILGIRQWYSTMYATEYEVNTAIPQRYRLLYTMLPHHISIDRAMAMRSRFIIDNEDLMESMRYAGINPDQTLKIPTMWYSEESILANPLQPEKWEMVETKTWLDAFVRLAGSPAGYFLLSMASRYGYFEETLFMRALLDSDYGALAMGIAINTFKRAFLRRWLTKYEDEAIEDFIANEITEEDFRARLEALGYAKTMVDVYVEFFKDRLMIRRRKASLTILKRAYQSGRIDREEFIHGLIKLGYKPAVVEEIIIQADQEIAPDKELSKSDILALYKAKIMSKAEAMSRLSRIYADYRDVEMLVKLHEPKG
jgi:hypothetical protein